MGSKNHDERHYKDPLREYEPSTAVIRAGYRARLSEMAIKPPLFRSSTFEFPSAEVGAMFFQRAYHLPGDDGGQPGLLYSRINNPNIEMFEDKMVAAERGAAAAALFPSGMSAIATTVMALVPQGGSILYSNPVYGGTYFFLKDICPQRLGVRTMTVDTSDLAATEKAMVDHGPFTMVYVETPANPNMALTDIGAVAEAARRICGMKTLVVVDNTFLGPVFQSPLEHGADIVLYSATKYIGGHSDLIAGISLARDRALLAPVYDYRSMFGATTAPDTAWLLTRSIETLWMRMERQAEKALKVAKALDRMPQVERVLYPGLLTKADGDAYRIRQKQCEGNGAMITFYLKDGRRETAFRVLDSVRVCHLAVSLGGTESLIEHPRTMTHSDMTEEDLNLCGISDGMIRLSVGLESSRDLIRDLAEAIETGTH